MAKENFLELCEIQGSIFPGFANQDASASLYEVLFFLKIADFVRCKEWLRTLCSSITTADQLYPQPKEKKPRRNIGFSYNGLKLLSGVITNFKDTAFIQGLARRSALLGDPTVPGTEGHPSSWVIGGSHNEADIILIVAHETEEGARDDAKQIEDSIYGTRVVGKMTGSGVHILFKQWGAKLSGGKEHFGFSDGRSQPNLRGISVEDGKKEMADWLWPGEFVFGYPRQDPDSPEAEGVVAEAGCQWAKNGSFLVFRRLRQDVPAFRSLLHNIASKLQKEGADDVTETYVGAKLIGRWQTGAPLLFKPDGGSEQEQNNFTFKKNDPEGHLWPFACHIRKAHPRDDEVSPRVQEIEGENLNRATTQTHRLLRRGISYGTPLPDGAEPDEVDRGLLFLAYQTSIVNQFEFVMRSWINNPHFKEPNSGYDPLVGQNNSPGAFRSRHFLFPWKGRDGGWKASSQPLERDLVIPTGGGYFFVPSISALNMLINKDVGEEGVIDAPQRGSSSSYYR